MKRHLLKFFTNAAYALQLFTPTPRLQSAYLQENRCSNLTIPKDKNRYSVYLSVAITLCFMLLNLASKAQITDTTIFPLNEYLTTENGSPYPVLVQSKLDEIDTSKFINVMNYGAKGDGKTLDDNAIANAFKAAQYGVIFPSGKTFMVSKLSTITLTHDLTVYAYGATIKMSANKRYSFLSLEYEKGGYHNKVIWLGGTLNGNKDNQPWPGSPTGNNTWAEAHGRFVGVCNAEFALFKDVNVMNTVMDGIGIDACKLGVIADSKAQGGAPIQYNQVQEQGTYFKFTRVGLKACYFLNLTCTGGSIGTHVSYPENAIMDNETLSVHVNCQFYNQVQNAIHIEDCYKNFLYNCTIGSDTGYQYHPSVHLSNNTGIMSIKKCQFTNAKVNFNNAVSLKLGIIDSCQFVSNYKGFSSPLNTFIEGRPTVCINTTFSGRTALKYQGALKNVRKCTFSNFDSLAISGGYAIDSNTFVSGTKPAALSKGGFVLTSTFKNVRDTLYKSKPANNDWTKVYLSYIDILSDTKQYLGRIGCGGNAGSTAQNKQFATAAAKAPTPVKGSAQSTQDNSSQQMRIYPNPTVAELHVTLNDRVSGKTDLRIYDLQGKMVQAKTIYKNTLVLVESLNVSSFTAGTYVLQIISEGQQSSFKFVVAK